MSTLSDSDHALNHLTETIIGAAVSVHRAVGPGLLESAYQTCLVYELADRGLTIESQKPLPLVYRNVRLDCAYRLDILVERTIIVEVKAIEKLAPIHMAQMLAYLKLSGCPIGLIFNFNSVLLTEGIKRIVHSHRSIVRDDGASRV